MKRACCISLSLFLLLTPASSRVRNALTRGAGEGRNKSARAAATAAADTPVADVPAADTADDFDFAFDDSEAESADTDTTDQEITDAVDTDTMDTETVSTDAFAESDDTDADSGDEGFDNLDDIFADAEDTELSEAEVAQNKPEASMDTSNWAEVIKLYGSFNAAVGYLSQIYPDTNQTPFASFENYLGFTARPASDIYVKGQVYTCFPDFNMNLDTLYAEYVMNDIMYITIGAAGTAWGNSVLFDTNILDDEKDDQTVLFDTGHVTSKRFDAVGTLPIGHGQLQGLIMYSGGTDPNDLSSKYLSYAGAAEYTLGAVGVKLFARKWAAADQNRMQPAVGAEVTTDLAGNHLTLWGKVHAEKGKVYDFDKYSYAKFVGGWSRLWTTESMGRIGACIEYQITYDFDKEKDSRRNDAVGITFAWNHIGGSDFTPAIQWYGNLTEKNGYVIPSLTYSGLSHLRIRIVAPVIYGGASYTYKKTYTSTKENPTVLVGIICSLAVGY